MGLITLLTDFGHRDSYVGVMKGVIAGISPRSQVVDLTHGIEPQAILAARFNLLTSYEYFPAGTIHVAVVDPGVGTRRAAVAAEVTGSTGTQTIVAPDNGIFTGFTITAAVSLTNSRYWRVAEPSKTFHGRDIFAPAAAHLANGVAMDALGESLSATSLLTFNISDPMATEQGHRGSIQYIDCFGNAVTTIPAQVLGSPLGAVHVGNQVVPMGIAYGDVEFGGAIALIGSHGYVEIAINSGNAAKTFNLKVGDSVEFKQTG